ncbi:tRNA uracil 4-sulfurtransferase ThiI [Methanolobus bombayensis]|uniref:tRNA uracil 4-sulfurtransferase ThiI n=1 Tax=Methanolobus bombayensis TaxID=38023 RepID=UPI001AE3061E|nr:tRNA uracil 4-sulfurtransferase ThiI [Methanolobus bombayensis]MBP1908211.1 thiamine biosynthesis protein ThiI [Methanolobus bombayensis]
MENVVLVRYGELALKSTGVRNWYEKTLVKNIGSMLDHRGIPYSKISREWGRIFIESDDPEAAKAAADVFGVVSTSFARVADATIEAAGSLCSELADGYISEGQSFAIRARRTGNHSFSSRDIGMKCGDAVWKMLESKGITPSVDLTNPDREIFVEMRQSKSYVFTETEEGVGGLPLGTQGKMVSLMSGGIDSPVATWMMMKRGIEVIPVYCNNTPYNDERAHKRTIDCLKALQEWCPGHPFKLYEVPHGANLRQFIDKCSKNKTCLLCKRTMYRIAMEIMKKEGASGIVTGSSIGQVASQTTFNMYAELYGLCVPLYHPLIGLDKNEIIDIARKIGTYDISIRETGGCGAVPIHPEVKAGMDSMIIEEEKIDIETLVDSSVKNANILRIDLE